MSELAWFDLEALGWKIKKYDERTRRYSYVAPTRNGKKKIINNKKDLDPCDAKYAEILYPKISAKTGKTGGEMRRSVQQDGGGGGGEGGLQEPEAATGPMEEEKAATGCRPDGGSVDLMEITTVVPGIKDHKSDLVKVGARLKQFMVHHSGVTDFDINKSVEDLEVALKKFEHPFSRIVVNQARNFFEDVIEFAMRRTPDLLYVLMRHTTTNQSLYDHKAVIHAATIYTQVATSINPSVYCALNVWLATSLQACGLTGPGLEILSTLGLTVGSRLVISVISCECRYLYQRQH
jgi:hypothetical protein